MIRSPFPSHVTRPSLPRRAFLTVATLAGAVAALRQDRGGLRGQASPTRTVLGIGAHYDDCVFGIPGTLLQARARGYRVVILSLIGDYENWKPVRGRARELVDGTRSICRDYGAEARFLDYASMRFDVAESTKKAVAQVVAEVQPDVAFMLWPDDTHRDHEVASTLSKIALRAGNQLVEDPFAPFRSPRRIYLYDNGPRHTIGFEPDTFVNVTGEWQQAQEWLGRLMALVRNETYDSDQLDGSQRTKESLARYRGATCGVQYAEAFQSANAYPQEIL